MLPDVPTESKAVEVTMLEGQCCMLPLAIENVGKFVVDRVLIDVESSSSLLSKYSKQAHPLVPFTGAQASLITGTPLYIATVHKNSRRSESELLGGVEIEARCDLVVTNQSSL